MGLKEQHDSSYFLADCMIGKLATWLRMLNNRTSYFPNIGDDDILLMIKGNMTLLTRDVELHNRAIAQNLNSYLIRALNTKSQFLEVLGAFPISLNPFQPLCVQCSGSLILRPVYDLKIPPKAEVYQDFWECSVCHKIYWRGLKWKGFIEALVEDILPLAYIQQLEESLLYLQQFSSRKWFIWALNAIEDRKKKESIR